MPDITKCWLPDRGPCAPQFAGVPRSDQAGFNIEMLSSAPQHSDMMSWEPKSQCVHVALILRRHSMPFNEYLLNRCGPSQREHVLLRPGRTYHERQCPAGALV